MSKLHGFTLKSRIKWVKAYPSTSEVTSLLPTQDEVDAGFLRLVASKNIGAILRMQDEWQELLTPPSSNVIKEK